MNVCVKTVITTANYRQIRCLVPLWVIQHPPVIAAHLQRFKISACVSTFPVNTAHACAAADPARAANSAATGKSRFPPIGDGAAAAGRSQTGQASRLRAPPAQAGRCPAHASLLRRLLFLSLSLSLLSHFFPPSLPPSLPALRRVRLRHGPARSSDRSKAAARTGLVGSGQHCADL